MLLNIFVVSTNFNFDRGHPVVYVLTIKFIKVVKHNSSYIFTQNVTTGLLVSVLLLPSFRPLSMPNGIPLGIEKLYICTYILMKIVFDLTTTHR